MAINEATNDDWLVGAFKLLSDNIKKNMEHSIPCKITKVISRTRVKVQPLIKMVDKDGNLITRQEIYSLPVFTAGAGDMLLSFPLSDGDLGWIDASDRDITTFLQDYADSSTPTRRMHSFMDARFIPDIMTNFDIDSEDDNAVVLQSRTGTVKIAMDDEIRIINDTVDITITGSELTGTIPGGATINGAQITSDGDFITSDGISLRNHPHNQGVDSAGNTEQATDTPTATET